MRLRLPTQGGGHLFGSGFSLADATLFVVFHDFFDNKELASAALAGCPKVGAPSTSSSPGAIRLYGSLAFSVELGRVVNVAVSGERGLVAPSAGLASLLVLEVGFTFTLRYLPSFTRISGQHRRDTGGALTTIATRASQSILTPKTPPSLTQTPPCSSFPLQAVGVARRGAESAGRGPIFGLAPPDQVLSSSF